MCLAAIPLVALLAVLAPVPCSPTTIADISQHPVMRLTYNDGIDWMPTLSADGNRLAWATPERDKWWVSDIFITDRVNGTWRAPVHLGTGAVREYYPDLNSNGDVLVYSGGHYEGLSEEVHLRTFGNGIWGPPTVIANVRAMGLWSVGQTVISGDGSAIVASSDGICFIVRWQKGAWSPPRQFGGGSRGLAINEDGTRVCVGTEGYGEKAVYVYDYPGRMSPPTYTLEEPGSASIGCVSMSEDGHRVAYQWWPHPPDGTSWVRVREERDSRWELTEFRGFVTGVLSGDGRALLLVPSFGATYISLTRFVDGDWHDPVCVTPTSPLDHRLAGKPALSRDGTKIAFVAGSEQRWQELYFFEYDFPGRAAVESNIPNAPFTLSGPIDLSRTTGPDCRWQCDQLYVWTWTVTWGGVPYYQTPPPQTKRTRVDETVRFCGEYVPSVFRLEPGEAELSVGRATLNYATGTFLVPVEIRNVAEQITFYPPMRLVFESFSPENTVLWNGDGFTDDGKPFIDLSDLIPSGLAPGSPPLLVEVEVYNRERNPFLSFEAHVTAAKAPLPEKTCAPEIVYGDNAVSESRGLEHHSFLRVESIALDTGGVRIIWKSLAGQTYRVSYRDDLSAEWHTAPEVTASGKTTEWLDESVSEESPPMRVYRVEMTPSIAPAPATR